MAIDDTGPCGCGEALRRALKVHGEAAASAVWIVVERP